MPVINLNQLEDKTNSILHAGGTIIGAIFLRVVILSHCLWKQAVVFGASNLILMLVMPISRLHIRHRLRPTRGWSNNHNSHQWQHHRSHLFLSNLRISQLLEYSCLQNLKLNFQKKKKKAWRTGIGSSPAQCVGQQCSDGAPADHRRGSDNWIIKEILESEGGHLRPYKRPQENAQARIVQRLNAHYLCQYQPGIPYHSSIKHGCFQPPPQHSTTHNSTPTPFLLFAPDETRWNPKASATRSIVPPPSSSLPEFRLSSFAMHSHDPSCSP